MAQRTEVVLVDDIDGTPAEETVQFALDGRHYEIDLSRENARELRELLRPYMRKGRAVAPPSPKLEAAQIRKWAAENGYEVSNRGRLHRDIVEAYRNARRT
ncbi:Lsr2 family protein [Micrococcus sp.]|uniref:histone-like nucleoid-structuring protein Lsr2 n=1 Tax=Micrococcus sp. TaxID=1271 RepID=UPI002A90B483|nr:Lsr2 family protein [Micrococcus sp.]MDY6056043.1 Lsr2 family protein [Micrococcus sp.]